MVADALESERLITGPPLFLRGLDAPFLPSEFLLPVGRAALACEYALEDCEYVQFAGSRDKNAGCGALGIAAAACTASVIRATASSCFSIGDLVR